MIRFAPPGFRLVTPLVFAIALALYGATTSRSVGFIDRGELAAAAASLGIAHPTGYPTLTLLGHAVTRLAGGVPIPALNFFAALLMALGAAVMAQVLGRAVSAAGTAARSGGEGGRRRANAARRSVPDVADPWRAVYAGAAALVVATAPIWWRQANGFEAYALHGLLLPLALLTFLRWIEAEQLDPGGAHRARPRAFAFALMLGLAFSNHMTTVLVVPAMIVFGASSIPLRRLLPRLPLLAAGLLAGLLPYVYLVMRAGAHPIPAWGDTGTPDGLWAHLSAWQYRVWMFASWDSFRAQAGWFFAALPSQCAWIGLAVAAMGFVALLRRRRRLAAFSAALFAATVLYASNYEIHDIDSYYMLAMLALGLPLAAGFSLMARRLGGPITSLAALALAVFAAFIHYRECDESGNRLPYTYTRHLLSALPQGAVLLSTQWDYLVSPAYVAQGVDGLRRDVTVLDTELLRRSWYVRGLGLKSPDLARAAAPQIERFLLEVRPFEAGRPFVSSVIENAYVAMIDSLIAGARVARPVLVTAEVDRRFGGGLNRVPLGLALLLHPDTTYVAQEVPRWPITPWQGAISEHVVTLHQFYARALLARAAYEEAYGRQDLARRLGRAALECDPRIDPARVPRLPLNGQEAVRERLRFFERLRRAGTVAGPRAMP